MLSSLSILFGTLVGFALGLTGGGGSLLAIPLLVYGLSISPRDAFGISLVVVGATALIGLVQRIRAGEVELGTGFLFAFSGVIGAPLGIWLAGKTSETVLMVLFSTLMIFIAWRMWLESSNKIKSDPGEGSSTCQREENGKLKFTSRCALLLTLVGLGTGFLSGMFGIGGGIVIVPALVMFSGMPIHRAVGTSLLVIVLISFSGSVTHVLANHDISLKVTSLFVAGGVLGLFISNFVAKKISGPILQKVFTVSIIVIAIFILSKEFF